MTADIPDLMRRFVSKPYGGILSHPGGSLCVESNSASFAHDLFNYFHASPPEQLFRAVEYLKILVEVDVAEDGTALTGVNAGPVRTLLRGTATVLICDGETHEVFAFLSVDVSCREFVERLLPAVISGQMDSTTSRATVTELQTRDIGSIAL